MRIAICTYRAPTKTFYHVLGYGVSTKPCAEDLVAHRASASHTIALHKPTPQTAIPVLTAGAPDDDVNG